MVYLCACGTLYIVVEVPFVRSTGVIDTLTDTLAVRNGLAD